MACCPSDRPAGNSSARTASQRSTGGSMGDRFQKLTSAAPEFDDDAQPGHAVPHAGCTPSRSRAIRGRTRHLRCGHLTIIGALPSALRTHERSRSASERVDEGRRVITWLPRWRATSNPRRSRARIASGPETCGSSGNVGHAKRRGNRPLTEQQTELFAVLIERQGHLAPRRGRTTYSGANSRGNSSTATKFAVFDADSS